MEIVQIRPGITIIHADCMELLPTYTADQFDLAVVDPPYGMKPKKPTTRLKRYGQLVTVNNQPPRKRYFDLLLDSCVHSIVWGGNYFSNLLPISRSYIFWHKHQPIDTYADGELAWTSHDKNAKCFDYKFFGAIGKDNQRIHPTQKPLALYNWIYANYATQGMKILDTHLGGGSNAIAAHYAGMEFVGIEKDRSYFEKACERIERETRQLELF